LIKLTTNKSLYKDISNNKDTFNDRLIIFLLHFAFFLKVFKSKKNQSTLQKIYDFNFKQLELSIREIGYGDQSINKKMKTYVNFFHSILSEIHFWDEFGFHKKKVFLNDILQNFKNFDFLVKYFDNFHENIKNYDLNSYLKSVNRT